MDNKAALGHIRLMEARIEEQIKEIELLKTENRDATASVQRLELLRRALDEMCVQLRQLTPTVMDGKRGLRSAQSDSRRR